MTVLLIVLSLACVSAGAQSNDELSGTIEFMVWGNISSDGIHQTVIDAFQEQYPNINVELRNPGGNHMDQLLTSIIAGVAPDLVIVDFYDLPGFIESGLATDVTEWATRDGVLHTIEEQFHPAALQEMYYNGRLYSVANLLINPDALFYNKDIFEVAGLPMPTDDWTIEDMRETAIRLTRKAPDETVTQYGLEFHHFFIWPFIRMNGGSLLSEDLTYAPFDDPDVYTPLQWLADIDLQHDAIAWNHEHRDAFSQGVAGMQIMWTNLFYGLRESADWDWDLAPIPAGKLGSIGTVKGNPVVIPSNAENKELAWEFLKFLGSEEANYIYGSLGRFTPMHRTGLARVITDSQGQPPANLPNLLEWNFEPLPAVPGFRQVQDMWLDELRPVWDGETSARLAGETIRQQSASILEQHAPKD